MSTPDGTNHSSINNSPKGHRNPLDLEDWEFPGWGTVEKLDSKPGNLLSHRKPAEPESREPSPLDAEEGTALLKPSSSSSPSSTSSSLPAHPKKLGVWRSTAICGNDITASCFYAASSCAFSGGTLAPIGLYIVAFVLYLYRNIYGEVGLALKMNGGVYTVLLNTTSKSVASIGACLSMLSYIATAVVSANTAMTYLQSIVPNLNVFWCTVLILGIFAALHIFGISESSTVAVGIFVVHLVSLFILVGACVFYICAHPQTFRLNLTNTPYFGELSNGSYFTSIFFGFSSAMLGVTGFETSSNFIEEQKDGVFPKTLRNMWIAVAFFNPALSVLSLGLFSNPKDIATFPNGQQRNDLLSVMASIVGGDWLKYLIVIDAAIVLSGSVLTGYVGVGGLMKRMSLDRCMPHFLLAENRRGTNHWITLGFFSLCSVLFFIVGGRIETLNNVYTVSFLSVMTLFAIGNLILKYKRRRLPRPIRASAPRCILAAAMTVAAFVGAVMQNPNSLVPFSIFFLGGLLVVGCMLLRFRLLKMLLVASRAVLRNSVFWGPKVQTKLVDAIKDVSNQKVVFFAKEPALAVLNKAILYVRENEIVDCLKIVHFYTDTETKADLEEWERNASFLDECYPKIKIDLVLVRGNFNTDAVQYVSQHFSIPPNFCFLTCPAEKFGSALSDMRGVRVITGH